METWKNVKGYEGLYQISNKGNVKSLRKWDVNAKKFINSEHIMKPTNNGNGYLIVSFKVNGQRKNKYIHRLVAEAFIDNPNNENYVNHKDFNTQNNEVGNLEWCSQKENIKHSTINMKKPKSITHSNTGEKYISFRASNNTYRVTINKREYGTFKTLKEAINKRNEIMK